MAKQNEGLPFGIGLLLNTGGVMQKNILDYKNGFDITTYHLLSMFQKTTQMFEYGGDFDEDDKISKHILESITQIKGFSVISKENGKLYANVGLLGGVPRYDYLPSKLIVNNPYIPINTQYTIDEDCVFFKNDEFAWGLFPVHTYFAEKLKTNDMSRRVLLVNTRAMQMLYSNDASTNEAIKEAFRKLENGELSAIFDKNGLPDAENVKSYPFGSKESSQTLIQLLEDYQYQRGSWWNEMGVQSNYNMKRETITSSENILNVDSLLPFADNMLNTRKENVEKVNKMFGRNWTVEFSSAWTKLRKEIAQKEAILANEANQNESDESLTVRQEKEVEENEDNEARS